MNLEQSSPKKTPTGMTDTTRYAAFSAAQHLDGAPGTVLLEHLNQASQQRMGSALQLQPQPTDDPNDPLNWSRRRKLFNFLLAALYTLMATVLLNVSPVLWQDYTTQLGIPVEKLNNTFAANCAGLAFGCLLFIPFALKYGRRPVYIVSTIMNLSTAVWQAVLRDYTNMIGSQVVSGLSGAVCDVLVQLTVADVFFLHERATMNAVYLLFFYSGAFLSPIAAGLIANRQGWPWVYWWCAIVLGILTTLFVFGYEETKYTVTTSNAQETEPMPYTHDASQPADAGLSTERGKEETAKEEPRDPEACASAGFLNSDIPLKTYRQRMVLVTPSEGSLTTFLHHMYQPLVILIQFPAVAFTALQFGAMLAWFSVLVTTESSYFSADPYKFSTIGIGLLNLAPFVGVLIATVYSGWLSDWSIQMLAARNKGVYEPEMRLYLAVLPAILTAAGLFLYGYSVASERHWIIPCIGAALFGFGNTATLTLSLTYMVDSYLEIVGDALVGIMFVRNGVASGITFAIGPWIESIGFHDTTTSLGCLSLVISLICIPMIIWGKQMRIHYAPRYEYYAMRQFGSRQNI